MTRTVSPIPTFEAGRLRYRAPRMDDFEAYHAFCASDRSVGVGGPFPHRSDAFGRMAGLIGHWHLRGYGRWMVADLETDAPLGVVGPMFPEDWPEPEIAWSVFENAEGKGIAHEAALFARSYAYRTLGWPTVISCIKPDNARSAALARRLGATLEGDYDHPVIGTVQIWRHPSPNEAET
ncbi:GNAT family N-acetyltransferase [Roseibacterium sp. SDUM158017]|uniref:GNAT family N-acetyltransferase n=1 Tax=Roseicyclus salinarum TaxID=3036773 RepID=UPI0024151111|nr:GNAT family N-acetyltransferase [Roseibacterium sp. SDUM158017]MDG4649510.1 GNAT family N-acetyltransferase [Roseibacterium sp. SDUM158017]